jgi:hypothetical protein
MWVSFSGTILDDSGVGVQEDFPARRESCLAEAGESRMGGYGVAELRPPGGQPLGRVMEGRAPASPWAKEAPVGGYGVAELRPPVKIVTAQPCAPSHSDFGFSSLGA